MKILIIDDKPAQIQKAIEAAKSRGWEYVIANPAECEEGYCTNVDWMNMISGVDGVVTDLMWEYDKKGEKPMGLLAVIHCLFLGKPVVICTQSRDYPGGHHGEAIGFINDGYRTSASPCPFGWEEGKDWSRAMDELSKKMPNSN